MSKIHLSKISRVNTTFVVVFLLGFTSLGITGPFSDVFATDSPDTISSSDNAPVSVSVSNSPLSYYISVSSSHGSAGTPVSLSYSQDGSTGGTLGNVV
ncbi:hypothetical protein IJI55_00435, partial [Candidatus Saccharibacteria bacterium]|nr:hypothetical protein [Candidatus Saccharibacteria bacterium]